MENASKALIIAGAILLSILIIGLGMAVYNNASSTTGKANLDAQEVSAHNSQFLAYEGKHSGSNVRTLLNVIRKNNHEYEDRQITLSFKGNDGNEKTDVDAALDALKNSTTYFVTFDYGENGCINSAEIHVYTESDFNS